MLRGFWLVGCWSPILSLAFTLGCGEQTSGPNGSPVARARVAREVALGFAVELDGSGSYDPEGEEIAGYRWDVIPLDSPAAGVDDLESERVEYAPMELGMFQVRLVVTDGEALSAPDIQHFRAIVGLCASDAACDDRDPCTEDTCELGVRCRNLSRAVPCDDGNPCTTHDVMCAGVCIPSAVDRDQDGDGFVDRDCPGGIDCDDSDSRAHPGAAEICDGVDNDCDGIIPHVEQDLDGDGFVACDPFVVSASQAQASAIVGGGDCDVSAALTNPAAAEGPFGDPGCADGKDNDCDGQADSADPGCQPSGALFACKRTIVIDHGKISGVTPLVHFPLLVRIDNDARLQRSGGCLQSDDGRDLVFVDDSHVPLPHELERFDSATGSLLAWVAVPALSPVADTVIHLWFGRQGMRTPMGTPAAVWDDAFRAVWHLDEKVADEASSGIHRDASANQANAHQGGNTGTEGRIGFGQQLDGNDFIDTALESSAFERLTFSLWFNSADAGAIGDNAIAQRFLTQRKDASASRLALGINNNHVAVGWSKNGVFYVLEGTTTLARNSWYRVDLTYDGSTFRLFLNGAQEKSSSDSGIAESSRDSIQIGRQSPFLLQDRYFRGMLDEIRLSSIVRSAEWIQTSYANQFAPELFYQLIEE